MRQILQDYFGVPVEIEQFVGTWRPIPESDQTRTGDEREYLGTTEPGRDRGRRGLGSAIDRARGAGTADARAVPGLSARSGRRISRCAI